MFASSRQLDRAALSLCFALCALLCIALPDSSLGATSGESAWTASNNSKVRLVSGTVTIDGKPSMIAGVQLRMEPGWKTYWRNPGDSGVPPSFDFPVKITPEKEGDAVELKLAFEYGLCKDICIPNEVSLDLMLAPSTGKGDAMLLESALALVPKPAAPSVLPTVGAVTASLDAAKPEIVIDAVFAPDARGTDLFIDGGEIFMAVPRPQGPAADGKQRFIVSFTTPAEAAVVKAKSLTLTLVSDRGSTETVWTAN